MHLVGARPQFVKAAAVLAQAGPRHQLMHTGQHYDAALSDVFFQQLGMPAPTWHLGVGSGSHGAQTGAMLAAIEQVLLAHPKGVMVVYGDTNSTVAGALAAVKLHWPVVHVEAGLRSFDRRMPEEINRVATDHISDLLLCPTQGAVAQLALEGLGDKAEFTGDVMLDLARTVAPIAASEDPVGRFLVTGEGPAPAPLDVLPPAARRKGGYALATVHRPANTDDPAKLAAIFGALADLPWPVLLPIHPRTQAAMARQGVAPPPGLHLVPPAGPLPFQALLAGAAKVFTDSGGVQKEALFAEVPCVTLRDTTEWTETLEGGWNVLVDADPAAIRAAALAPRPTTPAPIAAYGDGQAARLIVAAAERFG
ncbi:MAG: UDP-N-acetylglucosamine 2-epimerase (non-hydrolyzing) [Myxococcales bacterium]|nr:UDP-N-acetylglucosamine 2-epimerase (non-hydrolyzing) [Myxococcales bacterium]